MTYYVYILTNVSNHVLYIGVTNNLLRRVHEHRIKAADGFTSRYNITKLVYFEETESIESAILREKQLKSGTRARKLKLIEDTNPNYLDLFEQFTEIATSSV